ncbi:TPA: phage holin family protein [Streptococcus suis 8830]|uniref:phage holin, LLH family n=1 Tax=Streptococcus suis TaxID=1307 RepID=UPI0004094F9F|nr:phage holin, LLH family [Streptococcus suis]HEM3202801.1 phage holin family protein [Streptococcus suis 8830]
MTEIIAGAVATVLTSVLTTAIYVAAKSIKDYLQVRGGTQAVRLAEIVASNTVRAVEQMTLDKDIHGLEKFDLAKQKARSELAKYNVSFTDSQLNTFIESAVKAMNDGWKGKTHDNSK